MGRTGGFFGRVLFALVLLAGWQVNASAQAAPPGSEVDLPQARVANPQALTVGTVPQPTPASPGLVTGVTLGELFTNNLTLAGPGEPRQSSWITEIEPFLKSAYGGPRFSGLFNFSLTGYLYSGQSGHNQLIQNLDAAGTLTLLPQHLFLGGTAVSGRQILNNELPSSSAQYFLTGNNVNASTATLSPYWLEDLGGVGIMTLRYTRGRVVYDTRGAPATDNSILSGIPNVTSNATMFSVVSPEGETWSWNLLYSNQRLEPDFGKRIEFARAQLGMGLQVSLHTQLIADAGKESNFLPNGEEQRLGARFWQAGLEWNNARDDLKMLLGHRFFGHSYELSWSHAAALLTTSVSYVEEPTNYNQQLLGINPGAAVTVPTSVPFIPSLTQFEPYLCKRLTASATYTGPTSTLTVTAYDELRKYFSSAGIFNNDDERVSNATLSWLFNIGAFTTFTPAYGWQHYRFQSGQVTYDNYAELALVHQFGINDFGSIQDRYDTNNVEFASPGAHGYRTNVIFLQWTHVF